jgi:hypothetical protein
LEENWILLLLSDEGMMTGGSKTVSLFVLPDKSGCQSSPLVCYLFLLYYRLNPEWDTRKRG